MAQVVLSHALEHQACTLSAGIQVDEPPAASTNGCSLKRKAADGADEDEDDEQTSKRQRTPHHHDASPLGPYRLASIVPPDPLSINGILRQHCRKRLYVTPLHWKLQHLELLGCRFQSRVEKKEKKKQTESDGHLHETPTLREQPQEKLQGQVEKNTANLPTDEVIRRASSCLRWARLASSRANDVQYLLEHCGMIADNFSILKFCFKGRSVAGLHTDGIFLRASSKSDGPSLAFLNLRTVGLRRDHSIKPRRFKEINPPGYSIRRKKQDNIRPANQAEDPYIAAVLIALAQEQKDQQTNVAAREANASNREDAPDVAPKGYEVFVLALSELDTPCLYFYTARIPSSFLDRLDNPSLNIPCRPFRIKYHRIPLSPTKAMKRVLKFAVSVIHGGNYVF